ncbi:MAG: leucine-rich repeat domain-containing protein, partial [Pseudomonadota bacterium]
HASFRNASLEAAGSINTAGVQGADLSGANFQNAHLNFVHLDSTTLAGACFDQRSTLSGTTFNGAIMPGANFDSAVLEGISFNAAILENAVFTDATMKTNPNGGSAVDFNCAQLGGSSFANATVTAANFEAAVMPPAQACCPQPGGGAWCGTVDYNDKAYGAVTYPILKANVTCPNGDVAACSATQWLIPDWQTKLCNSRQAVETVWTKPDCGSTPGNTVKFKDQNLKSCILAMLPGHPSSITVSRAATLREVSCPEREISDLTGLENFTGLSRLDLTGNQIGQFNLPLKQLQKLNLSDNQLKSLDVSHLANLLELDVAHNQLQSIVGLVAINPEVLDLSYNQLAGFDLPVFDNLVIADLSHNVLTDVLSKFQHNLNALQSLRYLDLSHNSLATIGDAKQLANQDTPVTLYLECNPTFDCHSLDLTGDQVTLQKSACALFNSQSGKWLEQPHPTCLTSANLFGSKH